MSRLSKDCVKLVKQAKKQGWQLSPGRRHQRLYPPSGGEETFIVLPARSGSDPRAYLNVRAEMRRRGISV